MIQKLVGSGKPVPDRDREDCSVSEFMRDASAIVGAKLENYIYILVG